MAEERRDDFQERRKHLANLSDEELHQRFWELAEKIVDPLIDLAYKHTSPSIERSVLLRMGLSSLEAKDLVQMISERDLLGKGAGHIVWKIAKEKGLGIREAGQALIEGKYWDDVEAIFRGGGK
ncbi:ornithine aminomutase [Anoxybacter fermentans]|uniref:Ornithine aminomutase n=1 Tax=Anoxybacter fermentans TaxID=1323375 RepID=A0A3Q9HRW8_9FIRM|nr:ornithine aminomutase subunit alpha [Anoxybacter fermentans]AZR74330.1 ornithine aminomutase [Anoxybacter fermentans]